MKALPRLTVVLTGTAALTLGAWTTAAYAVSGGGYQPSQQDCPNYASDYATPNGQTYPGCHNAQLNVESGGTTGGTTNSNNTRYVQWGNNQNPNDPNSKGTNTEYSIGEPGYTGDPHSGCVAVNTDGTGGGAAPNGTKPTSGSKAEDSKYGCGTNSKGAGFEANYDYYQWYCPIAKTMGMACEDTSYGTTTFTPDTGTGVNYEPIVKQGLAVYFGMDDNNDNGEHDGLGPYSALAHQKNNGVWNGSSDGGAILLTFTPQSAANTPSQTHPEGIVNASTGFCADGICLEGTTQQQTVYHGCGTNAQTKCDKGTPKNANVYDYAPGGSTKNDPSVNQESANCNAGDPSTSSEKACGSSGMNGIRSATPANENAEPGVQIYSDPDSQRSPAAPAPFWPTPGLYIGTCGVYAGSPATTGQIVGSTPVAVGGVPITNQAGQVAIDPNPSAC